MTKDAEHIVRSPMLASGISRPVNTHVHTVWWWSPICFGESEGRSENKEFRFTEMMGDCRFYGDDGDGPVHGG